MELPRLSVVLPNYNHGAYLPACLDALFNQSAPPLEVIAIDDDSKDTSMEVLDRYARKHSNLRVFRNEKNQGVVYGLNRGLALATGDYVFFPAADDVVMPGLFEKSLRLLSQHPQAALSCTIAEWHDVSSGLKWHMGVGMAPGPCCLSPGDLVRAGRRGKFIICTSSVIFRKEPLLEVGGYASELRWHVDWFVTAVLAFRYGVCYIPEPLSNFYLHETSFYHKGRKSQEHLQVLARLMDRFRSPACADVAPLVRDSAALSLFGWTIVRMMLMRREYRWFLTPLLLRRATWRSGELLGKELLPRPLARLCLRLLYQHKAAPVPSTNGQTEG